MVEGPAGAASGMGGTAPDPYVTGRVADVDWAARAGTAERAIVGGRLEDPDGRCRRLGELLGTIRLGERPQMRELDASNEDLGEVTAAFGGKYFGGNEPHFASWRNRFFLRMEPERISSWDFRKIPEALAKRQAERDREA